MSTPFSRSEFFTEEDQPERLFSVQMEKYERCTFCHSKLVFTHNLNITFFQVIETSRCPGCVVTMNPKKFTLH